MGLTATQWVFVILIVLIIIAVIYWAYQQGKFSALGAGNSWLLWLVVAIIIVLVIFLFYKNNGSVSVNAPSSIRQSSSQGLVPGLPGVPQRQQIL